MDRGRLSELWGRLSAAAGSFRYPLLIIGAGLLLVALSRGGQSKTDGAQTVSAPEEFSLAAEEERLETALAHIGGVGRVRVVLTLKTTMETIYQSDLRQEETGSGDGGRREASSETVVVSAGSGSQQAVTVKRIYPVYQGALIVCEGAADPEVRLSVTRAVAALTGLSANHISVLNYE